MKNALAFIVMTGVLAGTVLSCGGGGGGGGTPPPPDLVSLSTVTALYPVNGANWSDYVKGGSVVTATDTLCSVATDTACMHGGEKRVVTVTGKTSCAGLTATDALGAFDWTCDASTNPVRMVSTGLKDGKYLSDLLDFTAIGWKTNSVTVSDGGTLYSTASTANWWSNPVVADDDGGSLATAGTVYLVTTSMTGTYTIDASKVAMVSKPGTTITGPGTSATIITADGSGSARDHLWIEGTIYLAGDQMGVRLTSVRFSVLKGVSASNSTAGGGINLDASSNNRLFDVTSSHHASGGIYLTTASNNNTLTGIVASHNGQPGITLSSSNNNRLTLVTASSNTTYGVYLNASSGNTLDGITASNNSDRGVSLASASSNTFSNITASNNKGVGIYVFSSSNNNTFTGVTALNNVNYGIYVNASYNSLTGIKASGNNEGILLGGSYNKIAGVTVSKNSGNGVRLGSASNNTLSGITASNNAASGVMLMGAANDNTLAQITVSNNTIGVYLLGPLSNNMFDGIIASNNDGYGIALESAANNNTFTGITAANNGIGLYLAASSDNRLMNIAASNSNSAGIFVSSPSNTNTFGGLIKVGNNNGTDCYVSSGNTNPGLDDDAVPSDVATDAVHDGVCTQQGSSDFGTATTGISLAAAFIGKVAADDTANAIDTNGTATYASITDWLNFENGYRGWGKDGNAFPQTNNRGQCTTGTCRIWDWSLASGDAVLKGMLSLPTGSDSLTHTWSGLSTTTFLRNAVEMSGDGLGNDNTLCESNETCLYTPNIGSYQGHGNLVSAGTFTSGTITGVTLMKYEMNGR